MNVIFRIVKPTLFSIMLMLLAVIGQGFFSVWSMVYSTHSAVPEEIVSEYGIASPITITTIQGVATCNIKWGILAINLLATHIASVLLSLFFAKATGLRRSTQAYAVVAIIAIFFAFLASVIISKGYWGYFFSRPSLPREINDIAKITSLVPFEAKVDKNGRRTVVVQETFSLPRSIASGKADPYYCLDRRLLIKLEQANLLPATPSKTLANLPELFSLIRGAGILETPEAGYETSDLIRGIALDARDYLGARLVILGFSGREVSNDHYPYYEMVFREKNSAGALAYVYGHRFFYDVAGIEGAEWYLMWPFFSFFCVIIAFIVFTIAIAFWRYAKKIRKAQQGFSS